MSARSRQLLVLAAGSAMGTLVIFTAGGSPVVVALLQFAERNSAVLALGFAVWALLANCLVLPAGSVSLIAGGAALGVWLPAAIWFIAQLATAPLLFAAGQTDRARVESVLRRYLGAAAAGLVERAAADGIMTTMVLRLTPVLPSAPACLIAAAAGIEFPSFMAGSLLAGWVRPLYFASLGATIGSLTRVGATGAAVSAETLAPLAIVAASAAALLGVRLWLSRRRANSAATAAAPAD